MKSVRWCQIGDLFDAASSMPVEKRGGWLRDACGDDETLRSDVEHLLDHDEQADRDGFLEQPEVASRELQPTGSWPPANGRQPDAKVDNSRHPETRPEEDSHRAASLQRRTSAASWSPRSTEETRSVVQSRLRELPLIHIVIFGMMLLLRPFVLRSVAWTSLVPFGIVAATFAGIAILLSARSLSLTWLRRIEVGMTVALAGLLVAYECKRVIGPFLPEDRIVAEKLVKNLNLLVSLVMLIDAI